METFPRLFAYTIAGVLGMAFWIQGASGQEDPSPGPSDFFRAGQCAFLQEAYTFRFQLFGAGSDAHAEVLEALEDRVFGTSAEDCVSPQRALLIGYRQLLEGSFAGDSVAALANNAIALSYRSGQCSGAVHLADLIADEQLEPASLSFATDLLAHLEDWAPERGAVGAATSCDDFADAYEGVLPESDRR